MFGSIGMTELIVIMVVALVVIGPKRLPELARTLGKALGDFKRATSDFQNSFNLEDDYDLDVLDEDTKQQEKKANAEEQEPEEDDAAELAEKPTQTETDEPAPEAGDTAPEAEADATENKAATDKTGAAREDETKT